MSAADLKFTTVVTTSRLRSSAMRSVYTEKTMKAQLWIMCFPVRTFLLRDNAVGKTGFVVCLAFADLVV